MKLTGLVVCLLGLLGTQTLSAQEVDLSVVHRIKAEAFKRSRVMDYVYELSDKSGPRLTGSPDYQVAANAAVEALKAAGIGDATIEAWGEWGRGWSNSRIAVQMKAPVENTLSAIAMPWSDGTDGPVAGEVIYAPLLEEKDRDVYRNLPALAAHIDAYIARYKGKLAGKILLSEPARKFKLPEVSATRLSDEELATVATAPIPGTMEELQWPVLEFPDGAAERALIWKRMPLEMQVEYWERQMAIMGRWHAFLRSEDVAGVLMVDNRGEGGAIFTDDYSSWYADAAVPVATVSLAPEHYNRIYRLVEREVPVVLELDVAVQVERSVPGRNVIANLPGSGTRRGELVMLGGHLDSWIGGTGAADNAAGSAVAMEVMRILKALDLDMDRTVRLALWDGEEQGYYGSRAYVQQHFADPVSMSLKADHKRLSAYYNLDNGGGKVRGIYLQSNDMARPIFSAWLAPFSDHGVDTISIADTNSTDHEVFDWVGLPGFQFIQDPLEYDSRTHHSTLDTVDHLVEADLMQAAAVIASVVYHTAMRDELLPRKPLPPPLPEKQAVPEALRY